jgi:hypothetical protein
MNKLIEEDLQYVVSRIPKTLRELMKKNNIYLAGGFIRALITGENPSDIDVLGESKEQLNGIRRDFFEADYKEVYESIKTKNAVTIFASGKLPIQLITRWLYDDPAKLIREFDFTIAQSVIWYSQSMAKWCSLCSDYFYCDLAAKRLRYTQPDRNEDAGGSILRVLKFLRKGYKISPEELSKVTVRWLSGVDREVVDHCDNEMLVKVLSSLLREVDPLNININNGIIVNDEESEESDGSKEESN